MRTIGYWLATLAALVWGLTLSTGRVERSYGLIVAKGMPPWSFGRGGTTIGGVYLTDHNLRDAVLEHESVHRDQWRRYGLLFAVRYLRAGRDARTNRFEIEAGLEKGGY